MNDKKQVFITQLGSPKSTKIKDVRSYLREFLSDPRVVDFPRPFWTLILYLFILPTRPKRSAEAYKRIEFCGFFPLIEITKGFTRKLQQVLPQYRVKANFILSETRLKQDLAHIKDETVYVFPQYPQYSGTTIGSVEDVIAESGKKDQVVMLKSYHRLKAFIDLSVARIEEHLTKYPAEHLVLSFHGIPVRYVTQKGDPYYRQCFETFELIKKQLKRDADKIHLCFQSRLGSEQWLGPYTDEYCSQLAKDGASSIAVYCPSFVVDCLETTDEIGNELKEELHELGCDLIFVPCLNNTDEWVEGYSQLVTTVVEKGVEASESLMYQVDETEISKSLPAQQTKSSQLSPKARKSISIVFLTLFLDLVGFSIIFPMFPALAKYYLEVDSQNYFLQLIFGSITNFTAYGGISMSNVVLFGGALGALYSLLQFVAAPLWGSLSDRIGRKPILLISLIGLFASYVIWIFSGNFTLLILSRFIGGIMGGNISTATAVVADVTDKSNRAKGMAFVGIAFAFGFILGPALGGIASIANPMEHFPQLVAWGLNPFSYAAFIAALLSLINIFLICFKFEETLQKKDERSSYKTNNIFKIFNPLPIRNVNLTNLSYFLFISAFSGMEFTLTFLAVERLSYTSMDNAYMFIFIGLIIAFVQGGVVRRKAHQVGEKKMAMYGLVALIPGLIIISQAYSGLVLYLGLFFLALGSAMAIPTLTALVSLYSPTELQGKSLGIFRSLGSLGRVIGPIAASLIYWKLGSSTPYLVGAILLIIPVLVLTKIKEE